MIGTQSTSDVTTVSPLETYLRQINDTPLLTAAEERELAYRIKEGDAEARDHLVRANLRLVVSLARSYQGKGLDLPDLIAEGNLGLLHAVEAFDPDMGTRFSTYAAYWVKQSMRRAVINMGRTIRLPAYMAQTVMEWRRAATKLQEDLGRPPTEEEVAFWLKLPPRKLWLIKRAFKTHSAAFEGDLQKEENPLEDLLPDKRGKTPDVELSDADRVAEVLHLVDLLSERERTVLRLRFGLAGEEPKTLKEVGVCLNLTRERVRQVERGALARLHEMLQDN